MPLDVSLHGADWRTTLADRQKPRSFLWMVQQLAPFYLLFFWLAMAVCSNHFPLQARRLSAVTSDLDRGGGTLTRITRVIVARASRLPRRARRRSR